MKGVIHYLWLAQLTLPQRKQFKQAVKQNNQDVFRQPRLKGMEPLVTPKQYCLDFLTVDILTFR